MRVSKGRREHSIFICQVGNWEFATCLHVDYVLWRGRVLNPIFNAFYNPVVNGSSLIFLLGIVFKKVMLNYTYVLLRGAIVGCCGGLPQKK